MNDDDEKARPKPTHRIGEPLDDLSIAELDDRVSLLRAEIARLEAAQTRKARALADAGSFFKA